MNFDSETINVIGNKLTESNSCYKRVNPNIWIGYYGLPNSLSKLAFIVFSLVLKTKFYGEKAKEKDIDEDRRIYTDISITIEDILNEWDHEKYAKGKDMSSNISNMNKRIRILDDNNVFYCWRYKSVYMFVMERDFRTWKFYNSRGCCIPKTLKKIVCVGNDMITCMIKSIRKTYNDVDKSDIESSFGYFLNRIIDKMNPLVATEVIKWDGKQDVLEYIVQLSNGVKNMEDYKGLLLDDDIFNALPLSLSNKLREEINGGVVKTKSKIEDKKLVSLEQEIIPDNPNLVKPQRVKVIKKTSSNVLDNKVEVYKYDGEVYPFKNAVHFIKYYRAFLSQCSSGKTKFDRYDTDTIYATQILDLLQEKSRSNKVFLNSWIRYFYDYRLKGNKMLKTKYTSLKTFKETFEEYNARHMEV